MGCGLFEAKALFVVYFFKGGVWWVLITFYDLSCVYHIPNVYLNRIIKNTQKMEAIKITITEADADKRYCGEFDLNEWLDGGKDGYGDQFNAQAVVILTKAVKMLLKK